MFYISEIIYYNFRYKNYLKKKNKLPTKSMKEKKKRDGHNWLIYYLNVRFIRILPFYGYRVIFRYRGMNYFHPPLFFFFFISLYTRKTIIAHVPLQRCVSTSAQTRALCPFLNLSIKIFFSVHLLLKVTLHDGKSSPLPFFFHK